MNEPKRLLLVNLNYLGDALFTTPALAALRARFPHARIDALAGERAAAILSGNENIDRLLLRPPRGSSARNAALRRVLQDGRYDAAVLFQSILANAALLFAAQVPVRVGFAQDGCRFFLTHPVAPRRPGEHVVAAYTRLAEACGALSAESAVRARTAGLKIVLLSDDTAFGDAFWRDHELLTPVAGLVIGATRPQKRWPPEYFARLADKLSSLLGVSSLLLGGPEEEEAANHIAGLARSPLVNAVGRTTEKQMAALVARCGVLISGDTGPLHIATALQVPTVALFGSTDPAETGPWSSPMDPAPGVVLYDALPCAPCRKSPNCGGRFDCMHALNPERVFDAAALLLDKPVRRTLPMVVARGVA